MDNIKRNKEIDVVNILKRIWSDKKSLGLICAIFTVLGVIVALSAPKQYTASVILAPEITGAGSMATNLSDLASMVGVDFKSEGKDVDAIYPEIYPEVVSSSDFITKLFNIPVKCKDDSVTKTYYNHIIQDQKIPFWSYPMYLLSKVFASKNKKTTNSKFSMFNMTKNQFEVYAAMRNDITCMIDKKTSVITINVTDIDPVVAATVTDTVRQHLQDYIIDYRTKKAKLDLEYTNRLYQESLAKYRKAQQLYASYSDGNEDLVLNSFKLKQEEMENDMQLKYNTYTQFAKQLQMAKSKVQEQTPVFSTIQSSYIPLMASSRPRSVTVIIYLILGIVVDAIWVLFIKKQTT